MRLEQTSSESAAGRASPATKSWDVVSRDGCPDEGERGESGHLPAQQAHKSLALPRSGSPITGSGRIWLSVLAIACLNGQYNMNGSRRKYRWCQTLVFSPPLIVGHGGTRSEQGSSGDSACQERSFHSYLYSYFPFFWEA